MEKSLEPVNLAYIGYGDHCQQSHAPFLANIPAVHIGGVAERDETRLSQANTIENILDSGGIATTNHYDLLNSDSIDAVVITTGDSSHFSLAGEAIEAGKHVLVEKPAAVTRQELAMLPSLFDAAKQQDLQLWVCHPREFGPGPWQDAMHFIQNPQSLSNHFALRALGEVQELRYDCQYTLPGNKHELHNSFADDKLNHTIVSAMRSLPHISGFENAVLLDNGPTRFDAYFTTVSEDANASQVTVRASGRRSAHRDLHASGVYRDWVEAVYEEGVMRVEPALGKLTLTYGKKELEPLRYDPSKLYDDMFGNFNAAFIRHVQDPSQEEPLPKRIKVIGTAAAIVMQLPDFDGTINEETLAA